MTAKTPPENAVVTVPVDRGEQCPSCAAPLAPDQRYCLECGHRRGDPRLPFMDAVVFMDAVNRPPAAAAAQAPASPVRDRRPLMSANASLVAGIGTLVLAIGVGVLIGRGGDGGSTPVAAAPQIIKVGGGPETASAEPEETATGAAKGKGGKGATKKAAKKTETGSSGTTKATEEVFKPNPDVTLPDPEVKPGEKCASGTAGCEGGEFTGNFFGE